MTAAMRVLRNLACLFALPLLAGCLMFERAPADLSCDTDLTGRWIPLPNNDAQNPLGRDDYALIDGKCRVSLVDDKNRSDRPGFTALGFRLDGKRYLALDQAAMRELFNDNKPPAKPSTLPATAVVLVKYRIVGEVLELALADMSYVVDQAKAGKLKVRETDTMVYLAEGDRAAMRSLLTDHPDLFESDEASPAGAESNSSGRYFRLRRASTGTTP